MRDCLIIIPTYNEQENVRAIIAAVLELDERYEILIVDDSSPDGTGQIVRSLIPRSDGRLHLLERTGKHGLGTAYIAGFRWALRHHYNYIFEMDADFSHKPEALPRLLAACEEGADMSVGSRYTHGGKVVNWPWQRVLLSYFASLYVRIITWLRVKDTTAGFVCYKRETLEVIDLDKIEFVGYAFQIEMKFAVAKCRFTIREVPITFTDRQKGTSKMSSSIFREALLGVLVMRRKSFLKERYYFRKRYSDRQSSS